MESQKSYRNILFTVLLSVFMMVPYVVYSKDTPGELEDLFVTSSQRVSPAVVKITVNRSPVWKGKPIPLPRFYQKKGEGNEGDKYYFEMDTSYWDEMQLNPKLKEWLPKNFRMPFQTPQQGSGMIISPDGYIVTAYHTVKDAKSIQVQIPDLSTRAERKNMAKPGIFTATLIGSDARMDIALIKINAERLPTVNFGDSSQLKVGQWAITVGYPEELEDSSNSPSVTIGHIGGLSRNLKDITNVPLIQVDAQISVGYGGGPVVNMQGQVIGMMVAKSGGEESGIGYAIPIDKIQERLDDLRANRENYHGWLGVGISNVGRDDESRLDLPNRIGALVTRVYSGSPADRAGFRVDDVILRYGDRDVRNAMQLKQYVMETPVGNKVMVQVFRKGNKVVMTVRIESKEETFL